MNHSPSHLDDRASWRAAFVLAAIVLVGYGFLYSLAGTALGRVLFPHAATGSLVEQGGKVVGSALVAQPFADARYFSPRPSAANYDPMAASGSNQARSNPDLRKRLDDALAAVAAREGVAREAVPGDLVTESGGGLDPHVSPAAARLQVARVAKARGLAEADVAALVERHIERRQFGLFGAPRVNVLELNLALDARAR
ncbi:K+-transporting ATPase ATPase C chain [Dokdonella fugitiva]|uniref:Potassium-transporting ATPase KdpC subunit n=1 Tax=Dokdonella fugitiva TaxID=328517 RepID=A0A839EWA0_9GAMM|nr:potassium-transporting ATPase subunit KdpC [Dokdonella fugitiva]MBA8886646.1 K+-transporting ATPase ATPase C chain [Dokdonella fugitiva]